MLQPQTMPEVFTALTELGFKTPGHGTVKTAASRDFYEDMKTRRDTLDYDVDGIVESVISLDKLEALGVVDRNCPRGQIAIKYPAQTGVVIIKAIEWSGDGASHLSPVAIFEPVSLTGAEIRRAHLKSLRWMSSRKARYDHFRTKRREAGHAESELDALAWQDAGTLETVGVGSVVEIARSGDVIPTIKRVVSNAAGDIQVPTACPSCGGEVVQNGAFLDCTNDECKSKEAARMVRFLTNLKVKGLGQDTLVLYAEAGVTLLDFFMDDGFAGLEAKIRTHSDISLNVWAKVKAQLEAV